MSPLMRQGNFLTPLPLCGRNGVWKVAAAISASMLWPLFHENNKKCAIKFFLSPQNISFSWIF